MMGVCWNAELPPQQAHVARREASPRWYHIPPLALAIDPHPKGLGLVAREQPFSEGHGQEGAHRIQPGQRTVGTIPLGFPPGPKAV